jgi:hypothetical protein
MVEQNQIATRLPSSFYDQLRALEEILKKDPSSCRIVTGHPATSFFKGDAVAMSRLLMSRLLGSCLAESLLLYASLPPYVHLTSTICRSWAKQPLLWEVRSSLCHL